MTEQQTFSASEVRSLGRSSLVAWGAVAIVFCALPSTAIFRAVPEFRSLFEGFGADVPDSTMLFLNWPYVVWVFPVATLLLYCVVLAAPADKAIAWHRRMIVAFAVLSILSLIVHGLAVAALYAPIFRMGAVV